MTEQDASDKREPTTTDDEKGQQNPHGSGEVAQDDIEAISGDQTDAATGQDHSLENYEDSEPRDGVGAIQNNDVIGSDIADITE